MRAKKIGRLASAEERAAAKRIVDMYRLAAKEPNGMLCINPEEPFEERGYFDSKNPATAIGALEKFIEHGTFQDIGVERVNHLVLNLSFDEMRDAGVSYQDAVAKLAEEHYVDTRTVERWLSKEMKPLLSFKSSVKFPNLKK